ncbi:hypothetical protein DPV78_008544 [Talaromyces pinophilus]|nr:hypothetical protein DPV78_008544 [Talaromyces pinophilus]
MILAGGIPSTIRLHPNDEWSEDELKEESKGWCQFAEEEWIPKTDLNEEMQQRRVLIERWASADQRFRDFYLTKRKVKRFEVRGAASTYKCNHSSHIGPTPDGSPKEADANR